MLHELLQFVLRRYRKLAQGAPPRVGTLFRRFRLPRSVARRDGVDRKVSTCERRIANNGAATNGGASSYALPAGTRIHSEEPGTP